VTNTIEDGMMLLTGSIRVVLKMVSFIFLSTLFQVYGLVYIPLYMMKVTFQHD
jgi:hypothetical protein